MKLESILLVRFHCPECGSPFWGSSTRDDGKLQRHCHGTICEYEWPQEHDWANFVAVTRAGLFRFNGKEHYRRAEQYKIKRVDTSKMLRVGDCDEP